MFAVPERFRIMSGKLASDSTYGNNGGFFIPRGRTAFWVMASDGVGWEHVSVHCVTDNKERTPTWAEMCYIKDMFWGEEDTVVQYHPPKSDYVNMHPHTLHLWRPTNLVIPRPPSILVGIK